MSSQVLCKELQAQFAIFNWLIQYQTGKLDPTIAKDAPENLKGYD